MRTDLDHLPAAKQRELDRVVQLLFEEFADANGLATGKRKAGRILKIILFGSYARGGWVDEPHTAKGYQSDYDLLIIVNQHELTDRATYWHRAEERLIREMTISGSLRTPVNFIVHTLQEVNDALAHGRFFFIDIARDGVVLYQSDDKSLHQSKPKSPDEALAMATEYFEEWFPNALKRFDLASVAIERGYASRPRSTFIKSRSSSTTASCLSAPSTRRTCTTSRSCAPRSTSSIADWSTCGRV